MFQVKLDDFLSAEEDRWKKGGLECSEKQLKRQTVIALRLKHQRVCENVFLFLLFDISDCRRTASITMIMTDDHHYKIC